MTELDKLEKFLKDNGYPYTRSDADPDEYGKFDRHQIRVFNEDYTEQILSVICHYGSYGNEEGLLEIMGDIAGTDDHIKGWLTADEIKILVLPDKARCTYTRKHPDNMDACPTCAYDDMGMVCIPELCGYYMEY